MLAGVCFTLASLDIRYDIEYDIVKGGISGSPTTSGCHNLFIILFDLTKHYLLRKPRKPKKFKFQ